LVTQECPKCGKKHSVVPPAGGRQKTVYCSCGTGIRFPTAATTELGKHVMRVEVPNPVGGFLAMGAAGALSMSERVYCDVCNADTSLQEASVYTSYEFRRLVALGFQPDEHMIRLLAAKWILSRDQAIAQWKQGLVAQSTTDWVLCPKCALFASRWVSVPKGTGLREKAGWEPVTAKMLERVDVSPELRQTRREGPDTYQRPADPPPPPTATASASAQSMPARELPRGVERSGGKWWQFWRHKD
jgi:hypothetical protein